MHVITVLTIARENRELKDQGSNLVTGATMRAISRIDCEAELFLTTLRDYVEEIGGELQLKAVFDDQEINLEISARATESTQMQN